MTPATSPDSEAYTLAERHVREAEVRVARQAAIVERLQRLQQDASVAQALLGQMNIALAAFYRSLWSHTGDSRQAGRWVDPRPGWWFAMSGDEDDARPRGAGALAH